MVLPETELQEIELFLNCGDKKPMRNTGVRQEITEMKEAAMTYKVSPEVLTLWSPQSTRTHRDMGTLGDMNIPLSVHDRKENKCAEDRKTYHLLAGVLSGEAHSHQQDRVLGHPHKLNYNMISHLNRHKNKKQVGISKYLEIIQHEPKQSMVQRLSPRKCQNILSLVIRKALPIKVWS